MPPSSSSSSSPGMGRLLGVLALLTALLSTVVYYIEQNMESFSVFDLDHLRDVSSRAVEKHGEDTRSVVEYIVAELNERHPGHVNLEEDWMFNNAGGAMGGMYIIHASEFLPLLPTSFVMRPSPTPQRREAARRRGHPWPTVWLT